METFSDALTFRMKEGRVGKGHGKIGNIGSRGNCLLVDRPGHPEAEDLHYI